MQTIYETLGKKEFKVDQEDIVKSFTSINKEHPGIWTIFFFVFSIFCNYILSKSVKEA